MLYYKSLLKAIEDKKPLISVLIDPDKIRIDEVCAFIKKVEGTIITHILVGGSTVPNGVTEPLVKEIKKYTKKTIVLFPGNVNQLTDEADVLLFLTLLSGRNPEYLIEQQIASVPFIRSASLEVISTGYILIDGGKQTATMKVTHTSPILSCNLPLIKDTAKAGELLGNKLIYLEAGSGALHPVDGAVINAVKQEVAIPIIVGGGIRSKIAIENAFEFGADMVVIGTAFEEDESFFNQLQKNDTTIKKG